MDILAPLGFPLNPKLILLFDSRKGLNTSNANSSLKRSKFFLLKTDHLMIFRWRTISNTQPAHTKIIKWYIPLNDFSPVYHYLHTTGALKILRSHLMISCFAQKLYFLQWFIAPVCSRDWLSKIYNLMIFRRCTIINTKPEPSKD